MLRIGFKLSVADILCKYIQIKQFITFCICCFLMFEQKLNMFSSSLMHYTVKLSAMSLVGEAGSYSAVRIKVVCCFSFFFFFFFKCGSKTRTKIFHPQNTALK